MHKRSPWEIALRIWGASVAIPVGVLILLTIVMVVGTDYAQSAFMQYLDKVLMFQLVKLILITGAGGFAVMIILLPFLRTTSRGE